MSLHAFQASSTKPYFQHNHEIGPNNFKAHHDHNEIHPNFHVIQDFLEKSNIDFALTNPTIRCYADLGHKKVHKKKGSIFFHNGNRRYEITPEVIEAAL